MGTINLLLLEDNEDEALILERELKRNLPLNEFEHYQYANEAIEALFDAPDCFNIIIADYNLPGMNGIEFVTHVREKGSDCPIVMVTGMDGVGAAVEALKAGADDYIVKDGQSQYLRLVPIVILETLDKHEQREARKAAESALRIHVKRLEERNRDLESFAGIVAHDVRSPISTMMGYAYLLEMEATPEQVEIVRPIIRGGEDVLKIVDSLLMFATTSRDDVETTPMEMGQLVDDVLQRLEKEIADKNGSVMRSERPYPTVLGKAEWVAEVWANYISNAIKYGGTPPVITLGWDEAENDYIRFWVQDNGDGLTAEQTGKLFVKYERLGTEKAAGTGLGLTIVQRIIQKLNGEVGVKSEIEQGSCFYFTLPPA